MAFENSYQLRGWESLRWICSSQLQTTVKGSGGDRRVEYSKTRFFHSRAKRIYSVVRSMKFTRVNLSNACLPLLLFSHSTLLNYYPFLFFFSNFHFAPKIFFWFSFFKISTVERYSQAWQSFFVLSPPINVASNQLLMICFCTLITSTCRIWNHNVESSKAPLSFQLSFIQSVYIIYIIKQSRWSKGEGTRTNIAFEW